MRLVPQSIKPASGLAHVLHLLLVLGLPVAVFILVALDLDFVKVALALVVLSKWRMFAVRPRFWAANVRANGVDLMVGLSIVIFMAHSGSLFVKAAWAAVYAVWLLFIKPGNSVFKVTLQAFLG